MSDPKISEIVSKIRKMHSEFGGENDDSEVRTVSKSKVALTIEKATQILESLSDKVSNATESYCQAFKTEYGVPDSPLLQQKFQAGMMEISEE